MMIRCEQTKRGDQVKVMFTVPSDRATGAIAVVGDFNQWNPGANPMKRKGDLYTASLMLSVGRRYAFRYLTDGGEWFNDETAHDIEPNDFGGENSVINLTDLSQIEGGPTPTSP
jgi:hypothetical protein